jgi:hypothetical protein
MHNEIHHLLNRTSICKYYTVTQTQLHDQLHIQATGHHQLPGCVIATLAPHDAPEAEQNGLDIAIRALALARRVVIH